MVHVILNDTQGKSLQEKGLTVTYSTERSLKDN